MVEFDVQDMSCGHCVATITKAIRALDPRAEVQADLARRRVRIESGATTEALRQALAEAGYAAGPAGP